MRNILIFSIILISRFLFAQVQITSPPKPGFEERIRKAIADVWLIDTHEHLETESERLSLTNIDFSQLFRSYPDFDLISAGMDPFLSGLFLKPGLPLNERWQIFAPYWDSMRNTAYGRAVIVMAKDLYGFADINESNYQLLSQKIRQANKAGLYKHILKDKARIELSIQDLGHRKFDPGFFVHVERFDHFIEIYSGPYMVELGRNYDVDVSTLDDYVLALKNAFQQGLELQMVGVKSALAYSRILKYDNIEKAEAEKIFSVLIAPENIDKRFTFEEVKPLQDYMMHQVLALVDEYDLPMQIHTGLHAGNSNIITNSKPTHLINLFMEFPEVEFCIFHSSYPYGGELSTLAKNFPNVFIDMCWSHIISPSYSERYLNEWLETVPANKILAFGGDYTTVDGAYAHAVIARQVVGNVLIEKVKSGYFTEEEAIHIAQMILRENALEIFKLQSKSRNHLTVNRLADSSLIKQLWRIHNTSDGFVQNWMIIGPFGLGSPWGISGDPMGFNKVYPPEQKQNFSETYDGMVKKVGWIKARTNESGYLDFKSLISPTDAAIVYAYSEINSPDEREVTLTLGSNDGAKFWVNNELVFSKHVGRGASPDQDIFQIRLKRGKNSVLAKVENWGSNWRLYVRVLDPERQLKLATF